MWTVKVSAQNVEKDSIASNGIFNLQPLPFVSSNPAYGFMFGLSLASNFAFDTPKKTTISNAVLTTTYTTMNQLMFNFKSNVYTPGNRWIFNGDWRFYLSSQPTYGLGIGDTQDIANTLFNKEQPMEYDLLRFHETMSTRVVSNLFLGLGVYFDRYTNINDQALDLEAAQPVYTSHFLYNNAYGFDTKNYQSLALGFSITWESRDIPTNASSGWYANLTYKGYGKGLGNEQEAQMLNLDYRNYFRLSEKKDNVLAFWFMGTFLASGKLPYMNLASLGWDQKGTSGRGYKQGRYRGENYFYTELEYRLRLGIDKKHPDRYGMVFFGNVSAASSSLDEIKLFDRVAPGYGTGFRIMLKKLTRSNITFDYARGIQGQSGFYINYNEFF